jgi:hypothetical protein
MPEAAWQSRGAGSESYFLVGADSALLLFAPRNYLDAGFSVIDGGLCRLHFNKGMTEVNIRNSHEVVGRFRFLGQHPILNYSNVSTGMMLAAGSPSVSTALNEFATTSFKYLECAFTRTIQESDVRMAMRVNNHRKAKNTLHMCGTGDGWVNRQLGLEYPYIRAIGVLG